MFSRRTVVILGVLFFIAANILFLTIGSRSQTTSFLPYRVTLSLVAPLQEIFTRWIRFNEDIWKHYFYLVTAAKENNRLKQALNDAEAKLNQQEELTLANQRGAFLLRAAGR